jgi:hypothetical protein
MKPVMAFLRTEKECPLIGLSAFKKNLLPPIPGETDMEKFLVPLRNGLFGFMRLACFLDTFQSAQRERT